MKFLSASLALLLTGFPITNGLCLKDALLEEGFWFDDPTLGFEDGIPCTLAKAKRVFNNMIPNLTGCGDFSEELQDVFGTSRGNEQNAILRAACDAAPEPSHESISSFRDIFELDYNDGDGTLTEDEAEDRFLKEFYDGNTFLNQVVGRSEPGKTAFSQIKEFDNEVSRKEVIGWPSEDIANFKNCQMNTVMCCWVTDRVINNGDNNGDCKGPYPTDREPSGNCIDADPADNTDICYVDMLRSLQANHVAGGFVLYPNEVEGDAHCHGFIWSNDETDESSIYKANNLFFVSMEDHLRTRGYVRNVPGAPMCGCLEQMPTVERADCTQTSDEYLYDFKYTGDSSNLFEAVVKGREVSFDACDGETANDLASKYVQMVNNGEIQEDARFDDIIVGDNCEQKIEEFLGTKGFKKV